MGRPGATGTRGGRPLPGVNGRRRRLSVRVCRALVVVLATALLVLPGRAAAATRILAVGDFGVGGASEQATGKAMKRFERRYPATWLVTLGDNDYTESPAAFRRNFQAAFGWLGASGVRVAGTLGNHDYAVDDGAYQLATLGMPARYYTRRAGDAELFLLDSNRVNGAQTAWLRRHLAASTARWKIVAFHHPPYVCGYHSGDDRIASRWVPLFERYGVQLILSGHEHSYQRFLARRGVTYVVHGGGGAIPYPPRSCPASYPTRAAARLGFGFLSVVVARDVLTVSAITQRGRRVDRVVLRS